MSQIVSFPSNTSSKLNTDPLKRDWNDFQHLATQGRYIIPQSFPGFHNQRFKLATVKKQLYNPKLPSIRRIERDEVLCRLPEEHCRHTTSFTEEQFQNYDPIRDNSFIEFSGLNWHDTGKALMGSTDCLASKREPSPTFGARLRADKSQVDTRPAQNKLYRSPSLSCLSPSASLTQPIKYSYRNYGNGTFDQSTKHTIWPRFHLNTKNSFDSISRVPMPRQMEDVFRSKSMYDGVSSAPWKPAGHVGDNNNGSKTARA